MLPVPFLVNDLCLTFMASPLGRCVQPASVTYPLGYVHKQQDTIPLSQECYSRMYRIVNCTERPAVNRSLSVRECPRTAYG